MNFFIYTVYNQEELVYIEQLKEATKGMNEVKYDFSIKPENCLHLPLEDTQTTRNILPDMGRIF